MQEAEKQSTQNAGNTPEQPIVTYPMVTGNNSNNKDLIADTRDNGSIDFLSELLSNHSLVSDEERKSGMLTKAHKLIVIVLMLFLSC